MLTRLKKRFLDLPISQKFVSIFAVMTLLSCAVMVGALHLGLSVFEEKLYEKSLQELDFFVQSIDDDLQQMDVLTRSIAVDTTIQSQLAQLTAADPETAQYYYLLTGVRPLLLARQNCTLHSITLRVLGGESDIEYRVRHLLENANPTAAIYCKTGECEIRITARAENDSSAEKMCRAYATKFYDLLGDAVYDEDVTGLEETLVHTLKEKGLTIATAESCTGGMIAQRLTNVSGASEVFGFGFVTYWEQAKAKMVGVEPAVIAKYNVVSAPVAAQMALGAAEAAGADIAVSVTGLAGPNGGDAVRPVGTVYLGAACGETVYVKKLFVSRPDRALVRARAAQAALELALRLAQGKVPADTQALAKSSRHDAAALTALDSTFLKG